MNPSKKLTSQQKSEQEQNLSTNQTQNQSELEFQSVEELLRHDALHTPVPPSSERRIQESIGEDYSPRRPWWKRLLGR